VRMTGHNKKGRPPIARKAPNYFNTQNYCLIYLLDSGGRDEDWGDTDYPGDMSPREECDAQWSAHKAICDTGVGYKYGFKSREYKFCMDRVDKAYIECLEECPEDDCEND
jgi:hypothetical protein